MYESNVDDVGYRLVAIYTPVREDGVEGVPVSASTEPITVGKNSLHIVSQWQIVSLSAFFYFLAFSALFHSLGCVILHLP